MPIQGNFLAGTTLNLYPLNLAAMALRQQAEVMNVVDDRLFVIETNTDAIYMINLNFTLCRPVRFLSLPLPRSVGLDHIPAHNATRSHTQCNVSNVQLLLQAGSNGFPTHNSDSWAFLTFTPYDTHNIYLLHTYRYAGSKEVCLSCIFFFFLEL